MNGLNKFFFDGLSPWDVAKFFFRGLRKGDLQTRSNSLAFSFFLALFPAIIFIFTLIPYIPIDNFQNELLFLIKSFLPTQSYQAAEQTIEDIIKIKRGGVLSIGFLSALIFSTEGIFALLESFNRSYHASTKRKEIKQRLIALFLNMLITLLILITITMLIFHKLLVEFVRKYKFLNQDFIITTLDMGKWLILLSLCFTAISSLYYFGATRHTRFKFISAGSTLATILILLTSILFNFLVMNFINYNKIYGSIGTLILIMIYLKFNTLQLLIGYELNASIYNARQRKSSQIKKASVDG